VIEGVYHTNPDGSSSFVEANGNSLVGLDGDDTLIGNDNSELIVRVSTSAHYRMER